MTSTTVKRDVGLRVGGHCPYPSAACGLYRRSASDQRVAKGGLLLACGGVSVGLPVWQLVFASRAVGVHVWGPSTAKSSSEGAQDLARPQGSHTCQCDYDPGMVCLCVCVVLRATGDSTVPCLGQIPEPAQAPAGPYVRLFYCPLRSMI